LKPKKAGIVQAGWLRAAPLALRKNDLRAENVSVSDIRLMRAGQDRDKGEGIKDLNVKFFVLIVIFAILLYNKIAIYISASVKS
jgi:hypothetical protein